MRLPEVQICQILKFYLEDYPYLSLEDHNCPDHPHKAAKVYQKEPKKESVAWYVEEGQTIYLMEQRTWRTERIIKKSFNTT